MADILHHEDFEKILRSKFNSTEVKFLNAEINPILENAEGFMGEYYEVMIRYERNGLEAVEPFFMKTIPKSEMQTKFVTDNDFYLKEVFQYNVLHKEFKKYGYDTSFAPCSFFCKPNETIVMEHMKKLGYQLPQNLEPLNVLQLKCVLKSLALYHGAGLAYQQSKSKVLGHSFTIEEEWPQYFREHAYGEPNASSKKFWEGNLLAFEQLIDLLPDNESYREEFQQMLKGYQMQEPFSKKTKLAKTCGHGDLWFNNMLFQYENGIPVKCCLIDYQVTRYFYPGFDVLTAIYCNTSSEFRSKHLTEMYQYYYDTLSKILQNYECFLEEIMPVSDFYDSIKLVKVTAMIQYLMTVSIIYLPKDRLITSVSKGNLENIIFTDKEMLKTNAFKTDKHYQRVVSDALYDLHEALIEYRKNFS